LWGRQKGGKGFDLGIQRDIPFLIFPQEHLSVGRIERDDGLIGRQHVCRFIHHLAGFLRRANERFQRVSAIRFFRQHGEINARLFQ
jgi:hypothetical protein